MIQKSYEKSKLQLLGQNIRRSLFYGPDVIYERSPKTKLKKIFDDDDDRRWRKVEKIKKDKLLEKEERKKEVFR